MKGKLRLALCGFVIAALLLGASPALAVPVMPHAFYGTVTINGADADAGTVVSAKVGGVDCGSYTVEVAGQYGSLDERDYLVVQGDISDGDTVTFHVRGILTDTDTFSAGGGPSEKNLVLVITDESITGEVEKTISAGQTSYEVDASDIADTTVTVKNTTAEVTITVQEYYSNPGGATPGGFSSMGKYIDVHIDDAAAVEEIEIRNYYTLADIAGLDETTLKLSWWDDTAEPPAWIECSDSEATYPAGEPTYRGYVWAKIRDNTIPSLDDLAGTPFMSMGKPAPLPAPPPAVGGGGAPALSPPGTTNVRGIVSLAGVFLRPVPAISEDGLCTLTIPAGTVGLTEELEPLTIITMLIMDEPPLPPEHAHVIGLVYDFQPSGATFEPSITLKYSYDPADIPEGIAEEDLVIAFYDQKAGEWVNLECTVDPETNTITALISHFTEFAILGYEVVPEVAAFTPSSLVISPTEVDIGQTVNVSLSVANTGGIAGSYKVTLKIDDEVEAAQQVTVGAGASETVTFITSRDVAGSYSVDVNGLSGSFTVKEEVAPAPPAPPPPAPPPEVKAPINWPVVGGIIAAVVVVVGLLIFFIIRRRRAY